MSMPETIPAAAASPGLEAFLAIDQAVLEAIPGAVYVCSADGVMVRFNRRAIELWARAPRPGDTEKDFASSFRIYDLDGRPLPQAETPMETVLRTGEAQGDKEFVFERPDGTRVVVMLNIEPLRGSSGRIQGAVVCMQDITARKGAATDSRDSEHHYRQLLEALPVAIYTTDAQGRVTFYNKEAAALAGREPELGKDEWCVTWRLYHSDGTPLPHNECPMAIALKEQRPVRGVEAIAERPDGQRIPFAPHPTPIFDRNGTMVGAVNMLVDLSQRRQADQAQQRLAAIVESSEDAIVSKDLHGIITSWNKSAERLFGYSADEIIGKSVLTLIPESLQSEEVDIIARIRRGERIEHYETVRRRKDGSLFDLALTISPIRNATGQIVGASKIARDITEQKLAQQALARHVEEHAALYELTDRLHRAEQLDEICGAALHAIKRALRCDRASILLFDDAGVMRFVAWQGLSDTYRAAVEGHTPWTADAGYPVPIPVADIEAADLTDELKATIRSEGIGALAFIPLVAGGRLIGKFMTYYRTPHGFESAEIDLSITIARQLAFSIERLRGRNARRAAEESLRESERRLELALNAGQMGAWEWNTETGQVICSPLLEQIHGLPSVPGARQSEDFIRTVHPEDSAQLQAQIRQSRETGAAGHVVYRTQHPDGSVHWVETFWRTVLGDGGRASKLAGVCMDVTGRKLAEEALRAREAALESIIDRTPFMLIRCTRDLRFSFVSAAYAAMLRRAPEEILGKPLAEVVGEEGFNVIRPYIEETLQGRRTEFDAEVTYPTIGQRSLHIVYTPERDDRGQVAGWIASILDVTERKQAESQRDLLVAELSHRVKNTLATVISIARQSFSKGPSIEEARRNFDGRILALAQTHGRLAEENWSGVSFEVMLLDEFAPYRRDDGRNVKLSGPSITLNPRCALVLGMAFHELSTNAAKYGALSAKNGVVNVGWDVTPERDLVIHWSETGGPQVKPPARSGFGRLLLERALASDLRGHVKLTFDEDGLHCDITVPLDGHVAYVNRAIQVAINGRH